MKRGQITIFVILGLVIVFSVGFYISALNNLKTVSDKQGGCRFNDPPCRADYDCVNNRCLLKRGCAYFNPPCGRYQECIQNLCVEKGLYELRALAISYIPIIDGKVDISKTGDWKDPSIDNLRNKISNLNRRLVDSLTSASVYRGYKNPLAAPSISYRIVDEKTFYKQVPASVEFAPFADHFEILQKDLDICDYVDNKGVRQVWLWMYHTSAVVPIESNMAMGKNIEQYWNNQEYGDVSNSNRQKDLPVCKNTYVVFDYNYGRGIGEALEDHGHNIEAVMGFIDQNLWDLFVKPYGEQGVNHCGWTHSPPNTKIGYDWDNEVKMLSDCEDWQPDGGGEAKLVNCHTWDGPTCTSEGGDKFKIWWMQNIPGNNNGLTYQGRPLKNWWIFIADFDNAIQSEKSLAS